jgi:hypothetical protein
MFLVGFEGFLVVFCEFLKSFFLSFLRIFEDFYDFIIFFLEFLIFFMMVVMIVRLRWMTARFAKITVSYRSMAPLQKTIKNRKNPYKASLHDYEDFAGSLLELLTRYTILEWPALIYDRLERVQFQCIRIALVLKHLEVFSGIALLAGGFCT